MNKSIFILKSIPNLLRNTTFGSSCTVISARKSLLNNRKMSKDDTVVPVVDIDPSGVFKYILIKVHESDKNPDIIVRGYKHCNYHSDIFDEVQEKYKTIDLEPLGGGRISHDPENQKIHVYGYSQGYGKADHEVTASLLQKVYTTYTITISDEGY